MEHRVIRPRANNTTGSAQLVVSGVFLFIGFILVNLRFYVRARMTKNIWWDDFFLLLGMLLAIALFGLNIAKINAGIGQHIYDLLPKQIFFLLWMEYISIPIFVICVMCTRISICLFLLRIFKNNRVWSRAMYVIMALIVTTSLVSAIIVLPVCKPVAKWWNPTIKGTCLSQETQSGLMYYQGGVSIFADFLLAALPTYFLKNLQISFQIKLSICALMSLGVFTGICAIKRTALTSQFRSSDLTHSLRMMNIWAGLEMHVAIIAAAIPALRPLWANRTNQKQEDKIQARSRPPRPNSIHAIKLHRIEADSPSSGLETRTTTTESKNKGDVRSEARLSPECAIVKKTSDISMPYIQKLEGKQIPEYSSLSDKEKSVEDLV